jgi:hypothetical protein
MNPIGVWACRGAVDGRLGVVHVAALAALVAGVVPAPAHAQFGAAVNVSKAGDNATDPQLTVDAGGNVVFVWNNFGNGQVHGRRRSAAGPFGPWEIIDNGGQTPQIAGDPAGNSVMVWRAFDGANWRVEGRRRSSAGVLSPVRIFSPAGRDATDPRVAVDADGDAVVVWRGWDGTNYRIQARRRSKTGVLGLIHLLSDPGQYGESPRVAVDADGDAVIVWYRFDGTNYRVQARALSAADVLGPVKTVSAAGQNAIDPHVAIDTAGNALIAWQRVMIAFWRIQARTLSAAGTLGPAQTLSQDGGSASAPQVAVDADGDAVIAWLRSDGANERVQARGRSAAGVLTAIRTLSAAGQNAAEARVAVDAGGDGVVIWRRSDGAAFRVQARTFTVAGAMGPAQTLSAAGQTATAAQVAVNATGKAVAAWYRSDGATWRIQTATTP